MTSEFEASQNEMRMRLYRRHLEMRQTIAVGRKYIPYRWYEQPDPISAVWLAYSEMADDFCRELANAINRLTNDVHRLRAWDAMLPSLSNEEKIEASHEFIETIGTTALGLPYVIKSRFAFAAAHLCHQANRAKYGVDWKDEFQDQTFYLHHVDPFGRGWRTYRKFKNGVEPIGGKKFKEATGDFRNAYNHRFPRRLVLGLTGFVIRVADDVTGRVSYRMGGMPPLELKAVTDLLSIELDLSCAAFQAFQDLVREHWEAIQAFECAP